MEYKRHGLSIGIERTGSVFMVTLKVQGKLTHEDYQIINPLIDAALAQVKQPVIDVYVDATQLEGWEARAAWDDFKLGLKHGSQFNKIAIVGNKTWLKAFAKLGNWFIAGELKYFESEDQAMSWLQT